MLIVESIAKEGLRQAQTDNGVVNWVLWLESVFPSLRQAQGKLGSVLRHFGKLSAGSTQDDNDVDSRVKC